MNNESLKEYLSSRYQGWSSFLNNVIFPIFGEEDFEDGYETELLESQPERRQLAEVTGIRSIKQVGMMYVGVEPLQIFDVAVSNRVMMERNRVNIQRIIRSVMDKFSCAFILFHYENDTRWDWRFTYCRMGANDKDSTDSKRYTFLLGPGQSCRTVAENFLKLAEKRENIEIVDIERAFSVEALSDEFFSKYKAQYEKFVCFITGKKYVKNGNKYEEKVINDPHPVMYEAFNKDDKLVRDYIKQMLGRITFLHFLQKKGWMGVPEGGQWGEGDLQFMRNLFIHATDEQKDNFLDAVLEPLYDKGLDTDRNANNDLFDTGVALEQGSRVRIPYLNGGLFERNSLDEIPTRFPADYFSELFEFFYQYNFTIDENDPSEAQVGVDPEMLGRIFENLLEDNKDKGAYYTPKEIVRYMCRQSLIAYLQTDVESEADREAISQFVGKYDASLLPAPLVLDIDERLKEVKVCDPAIGSGAFPMGMLKEIFLCRGAIENFDKAADIKRHIIQNNIYGVDIERGAVDIARLRFWLSLVVDEESPETLPNLDFKIMQGNSLLEQYEGIDLSKLATLSNVQFYEPQRNLFGEIEDKQLKMTFAQTEALQEFQNNLKKYFSEDRHNEKKDLRKSIEMFVRDTIAYTLESKQRGFIHSREMINASGTLNDKRMKTLQKLDAEIERLNQLVQDATQMDIPNDKFFLWHTWFADVLSCSSDCNGFDIVIGNPPYLRIQELRKSNSELTDILSEQYKSATGSFDLYVTFVEKAMDIIKEDGVISYIMPIKWTNSTFGKGLREILLQKSFVSTIINFGAYQVFEASTYTGIHIFKRTKYLKYLELNENIESLSELDTYLNTLSPNDFVNIKLKNSEPWVLTNKAIHNVLEKLNKFPCRLSDVFEKIFQGIATSKDDVYFLYDCLYLGEDIIEGESKYLNRRIEIERDLLKPLLKGEDVHRYELLQSNRYVIFPYKLKDNVAELYTEEQLKTIFPKGYKYLKECENVLRGRENGRLEKDKFWYRYIYPKNLALFQKEKLVAPEISLGGNFSYDEKGQFYSTTTIYGYIKNKNCQVSYETLLGIMNSSLCWWFLKNTGTVLANGYFRYKPTYLKPFPLPAISHEKDKEIKELVKKLLHEKDVKIRKGFEASIDKEIYDLYCLTSEDVKIIIS